MHSVNENIKKMNEKIIRLLCFIMTSGEASCCKQNQTPDGVRVLLTKYYRNTYLRGLSRVCFLNQSGSCISLNDAVDLGIFFGALQFLVAAF